MLTDGAWLDRAYRIAETLLCLRYETERGASAWLVEDPEVATADLMVGSAGVVHFLLRLAHEGRGFGMPLSVDP